MVIWALDSDLVERFGPIRGHGQMLARRSAFT